MHGEREDEGVETEDVLVHEEREECVYGRDGVYMHGESEDEGVEYVCMGTGGVECVCTPVATKWQPSTTQPTHYTQQHTHYTPTPQPSMYKTTHN